MLHPFSSVLMANRNWSSILDLDVTAGDTWIKTLQLLRTPLWSTVVMTPPIPDIVMTLDVDLVKDPLRRLQEVLLHLHGNIPGQ